jgi:two-component system chemotaxis response regulator CheB
VAARDIIVVGASAGGVEALQGLARGLPAKFSGSIFVTIHFPEHGTSTLPRILSRAGPVPAIHAADGESIVPGRIYVAPPDYHLLLHRRKLRLVRGPKENGHRPAIDPMFRSAALAFGSRVIGIILSGNLDDGTSGVRIVKRRGGLVVVQDPEDALFPSMPQSAIEHVNVDRVVPLRGMAKTLAELMAQPAPEMEPSPMSGDIKETQLSEVNLDVIADEENHPGTPSAFGCPDCGGVLWELKDGDFTRFRCRVGHSWTAEALLARQSADFDDALWMALRSLEESASLSRQIETRHRARGTATLAQRFEAQAQAMERRAQVIRDALLSHRQVQINPDEGTEEPRRAS